MGWPSSGNDQPYLLLLLLLPLGIIILFILNIHGQVFQSPPVMPGV